MSNDGPIRNVRVRTDKRNDPIDSSPMEENRRHLCLHGQVGYFLGKIFYLPDIMR
jgi:hypothetical protein